MIVRLLVGMVVLLLAMTGTALSAPKRVLIVHSVGRDFSPWDNYAKAIREELARQSNEPIDIFETALTTARFSDGPEGPLVDYLNTLFAERKLDLIMTIGGPAARFIQSNRQKLFPTAPVLYAAVEQRIAANTPSNDAIVSVSIDVFGVLDQILTLMPRTTNVAVVVGNSPIEKRWLDEMKKHFQPFTTRVVITYFNELSLEQILQRVSVLPAHTVILYAQMLVDAAGVVHEGGRAMARLQAVANAPMFADQDAFFGHGIVGGRMTDIADVGRQTAAVAVRILDGATPGNIQTATIGAGSPRYDWRELTRWNIAETRLPPGSEVRFREPGLWEQHRPLLTAVLAAIVLQAGIICWLLVERRRRIFAQMEATNRRHEVVRLNRVTTASILSSSIAHELNQPLSAIMSNAEAAQMLLKADPPNLVQLGEILCDIVQADQRASDIIGGLRNLLNKKSTSDLSPFDLNNAVRDVVKIVSPEVSKRGMVLRTILAAEALPVRCDPIHLQQVIINLVINGLDAMEEVTGPNNLTIRTRWTADAERIEVTVSDTGAGIPHDKMSTIFDAFVTTKSHGTGLGLPIARTILESYGGELWVEKGSRGAVFSFRLPADRTSTA
jgi:signal transduction histidine kinase